MTNTLAYCTKLSIEKKFYKFCLRSGFPMSEVNELVEVRDLSDG